MTHHTKKRIAFTVALALIVAPCMALAAALFPRQGGTGTARKPLSGQLLIGNVSGTYSPVYLTAGANITISTSSASTSTTNITITAAGGAAGSSSPGGIPSSIQFNGTSSNFAGDAALVYGTSTQMLQLFGVVSSTQLRSPSGTLTVLTFTSATGTNLTVTSNAIVSGFVSSTQLMVASGTVNRLTFTNATATSLFGVSVSSTNYTASGYGLFPSLYFTNASGTNMTLSGFLQGSTLSMSGLSALAGLTFTNATGTNVTMTGTSNLATSTVSTTLIVLGITSSTELRANSSTIKTQLTVPVNTTLNGSGQIGISSATGTLNFFDGMYDALSPTSTKEFIIENPTASEDDAFYIAPFSGRVTAVNAVNKSNGDTVTFNIQWGQSRASTTAQGAKSAFTANQAVTATTTLSSVSVNGSSTFIYGDIFRFITSAASSSQTLIQLVIQARP